MLSGLRMLALGAISLLAVAALSSCDIISNLLGIKGTLQIQSISATYDTTGGTGLKSITLTVQDSGGADATDVTYQVILNGHTTYDGNTVPVIYKGQLNGTIKSGSSQDIIVNASDIATFVADASNQVSAPDKQYYLGATAAIASSTDEVNDINNQPVWWIHNTFAVKSAAGQLTAEATAFTNSGVTPATGHYNVYVGLIDASSPIFVSGNNNLSFAPSALFSGAWNVYSVNYDITSGFSVPINFLVGTPDTTHYQYYMGAFIDVNGDGKLNFDAGGAPAEPTANYTSGGGSLMKGDLLSLGTDQTSLNFHF